MGYPQTSDGRRIFLPSRFRGDVDPFFAGCDDVGNLFSLNWSSAPASPETKTMIWSFSDWVYVAKGAIRWQNAGIGDYAAFKICADATTVTPNAGLGNCNLVPSGLGFNYIVAAAGDGSHDYSNPVPIPAGDAGYWAWDEPDTGLGTLTFVPAGGQKYVLMDIPVDLVRWIRKIPLLGDGFASLAPETKARKMLPHWKFVVDLHNESLSTLAMVWYLDTARKKTT